MSKNFKQAELNDKQSVFFKSDYTAIVSDLHLCEAEEPHKDYPLWKKYKSREFFFDQAFSKFLVEIQNMSEGNPIELILNGDIFDFDTVCSIPKKPQFRVSFIEKTRGLYAEESKSIYKIKSIFSYHPIWTRSISEFIKNGNKVVFVVGNHDLELLWTGVQEQIVKLLNLESEEKNRVRFCEFFYISNQDTLIEHGHQYDPYCRAEDPLRPFVLRYNKVEVKIPFGNLASRYMINGMGFFNPYLDTNFIMGLGEYIRFFFKYMLRAQPFLLLTWLWGATITLVHTIRDRLRTPIKEPLTFEKFVDFVAIKANATPGMVRQMNELAIPSASAKPFLILRELWLDRAILFALALLCVFMLAWFISYFLEISLLLMMLPFLVFVPYFIFYSRTFESKVMDFKEPEERTLSMAGQITGTKRVIYGHTHIVRHEMFGPIEHLNSGTWSPAFKDVECIEKEEQRTFVWIEPHLKGEKNAPRYANLFQMTDKGPVLFFKKARLEDKKASPVVKNLA